MDTLWKKWILLQDNDGCLYPFISKVIHLEPSTVDSNGRNSRRLISLMMGEYAFVKKAAMLMRKYSLRPNLFLPQKMWTKKFQQTMAA